MPTSGNEVQIAADAGLSRVDVAEIVRAVDDPEFLVAGRIVENFLVIGENDQRGKAQLGADGYDVFFRILHDTRRIRRCPHRSARKSSAPQDDNRYASNVDGQPPTAND